ncbi:MAG: type II secretion system secretin GspD [Epsilonproteobacteria bacterium]|nr:type II secretion system secretin GspD [Campylobacterota bacterium]
MKYIKILFIVTLLVATLEARQKVNVNFANLQIADFIKLISKVTHKNILVNTKINGTVNFITTQPIYDDELMDLLVSVLESKGYTLVANGSFYEIVRSSEAAKHSLPVISSKKRNIDSSTMVTQAIQIKDANVDLVASKVRYLISKTAKLVTMKESNTLLITDYPKNIETIKKVISKLNMQQKNTIEVVYLQNTEAKKLSPKLNKIVKSMFQPNVATQSVKIVLDENINGLILVGSKESVEAMQKIVKKLDVESNINSTVQIFKLKNSDAKAVLKTLTDIVSKQIFKDPAMKPNISASDEINSIVVIGDPLVLKGLKKIIDELDKEKFQVYVQAKIVEINKDKSKDIGIKYGFSVGDISSSGLYAMSANFGSEVLTSSAIKVITDSLGNNVIGVTKSALALNAAVNFLQNNGAAQSVSNPSILCTNNRESSIYVGKTISVNSGTTAAAGSTTTSFKREDVGLKLKIKPRVSSKDKVTLDVEAVLENVLDDGSKNATGQPVTSKQEVKTQAILRHGESIIIGGLVKTYETQQESKVPLLGDIPLLGLLFTSTSKQRQQDNLVVVLTPYVIDKSEELSQLQKDLGVLSKIQEKYNQKIFKEITEKNDAKN